ncbi:MAG: sigma-54-dependent Fis family transcriptional regulator [Phycisphaerales bacterium]|nr:MAG: sigma-54-dependent Fis family transcriptional regulator [Phycisphaerales bacterium]
MAKILLVDDETSLLHSMELRLARAQHECRCAETIAEARLLLDAHEPDLLVADIRLPDGNGLDLVREIRKQGRTFPVVVLTAFGSIPNAVSAMRDGADDYIEKPIDLDQLSFIVERNLETQRLRGRIELYERIKPEPGRGEKIIGQSPLAIRALELARKAANPGVTIASELPPVLLTGETGTGKDLLARHIHAIGPLRDEPLVHIDCASLPRELIESELFGHERGAFTDAKSTKRGLLEIASGGTVFLNELGDVPLELQSKLLTALERKVIRHVGGTRDLSVNVRIIAATNADLKARVREKRFREDLYYRLNVFMIELPPLRRRGDDVFLLADHFITALAKKYHRPHAQLSVAAREALLTYHWPGNVRELRHVLERAILLTEKMIHPEHLGLTGVTTAAPGQAGPSVPGQDPSGSRLPDNMTLPEMESRLIEQVMQKANGNVSKAARMLGISRGALRRRLQASGTPFDDDSRTGVDPTQ